MINVLFAAADMRWEAYQAPLMASFEARGLKVNLAREHPAEAVDYIIFAPNGPVSDFTPFTGAKAVLSLWAGVENIVTNRTMPS